MSMNAGGAAGALSWVFSVPQDIIKKKQQCHLGVKPLSMLQAYTSMMSESGVRGMFKGFSSTIVRGYLVNAIILPLYDGIKNNLD